jgi:nickel/cobalt exporter
MTPGLNRLRNGATALRLALSTCLVAASPSLCWAAGTGPFGVGLPEGNFSGLSMFPRILGFLVSAQIYFNQHLTAAVKGLRQDSAEIWTLLALSFLYGVIHAAGPGHGKAIVSSYVLATRQTLRNGIILAVTASLAQAVTAIALILAGAMLFRMTSVSLTVATHQFEIASNALIFMLGCWLVWVKILKPARTLNLPFEPVNVFTRPATYLRPAALAGASRFQALPADGAPGVSALNPKSGKAVALEDCDCDALHMPDGRDAAGPMDWRKAWTVVASTGLRPCTGALIVLVFAISQKLLWAGIASTVVMAIGTAVTVSVLAVLAVMAQKAAYRMTGADTRLGNRIKRGFEILGAVAIFTLGLLLLLGSLMT